MNELQDETVAQPVDHEGMTQILRRGYKTSIPAMVWGTFGIGKSTEIKNLAETLAEEENREFVELNEASTEKLDQVIENPENYWLFIDKRLSQSDPSDLKGIPDLNQGDSVEWKPPKWVEAASQEGLHGFVFLDEINHAPKQVQKAAYQLINDHQVNEHSLSEDVYVAGAGNRAVDGASIHSMDAPLRNRIIHMQLNQPQGGSEGEWLNWATENGVAEPVIAYISSNVGETDLFKYTEENREAKAIPTPRTWEYVSDLIQGIDINENNLEKIKKLAATAVGTGTAQEFKSFLKVRQDAPIENYIENPERAAELQDRDIDFKYSVLTGIANEYRKDEDKLEPVIEVANNLQDEEMATLLMRLSKNYREEHFTQNAKEIDGFTQLVERLDYYLFDDQE